MRNLINAAAGTVMCAVMAVSVAPTKAVAGVVGIGDQAKVRTASPVEQVYYRYYGHRHYYHHYRHYSHWRHPYYRHYYGYYPYYNPVGRLSVLLSALPRPWRLSRSGVGDTRITDAILDAASLHRAAARRFSRRYAR